MILRLVLASIVAFVPALTASAQHGEISRSEVIDRAAAYTYYLWRATDANLTAECVDDEYESAYFPGDQMGVAYDWGGFDSLFQFDQNLADGEAAGSPAGGEVYSCTTGVDCSGFVSRTWDTGWKYGTSTLAQISDSITMGSLLPGDVFNDSGNHVVLFSHRLASGQPFFYEAAGFHTRVNTFGGWSYVSGYIPRRFHEITGTTVSMLSGTPTHPIVIGSLPFADSRDTRTSSSDLLDGCSVAATADESGPEYVYRIEISTPGRLTVAVSDDASTDIDVHLLSSWSTADCIARHDSTFTTSVDCGTYYVVADTFRSSGGTEYAGNFDLMVTMVPTGAACGAGPRPYDPAGGLGDPCSYPGDPDLPYCNPTLGAETCLYTSTDSFCTAACDSDSDCSGMPSGSCCADIGDGEWYCVTDDLCPDDVVDDPDAGVPLIEDGGVTVTPADGGRPLVQDAGEDPVDSAVPPGLDDAGEPRTEDPPGPGDAASGGGCGIGSKTAPEALLLLVLGLIPVRRPRR